MHVVRRMARRTFGTERGAVGEKMGPGPRYMRGFKVISFRVLRVRARGSDSADVGVGER